MDTERCQYPHLVGGPGLCLNLNHVALARRGAGGVRMFFICTGLNETGLANILVSGDAGEAIAEELLLDVGDAEGEG